VGSGENVALKMMTDIRNRSMILFLEIQDFAKKAMAMYRGSSSRDKMRVNVIFSCTGLVVFWMTYMVSKSAFNSSSSSRSNSMRISDSGSGGINNNYGNGEIGSLEGVGRLDNKVEYKEEIAAKEKANIDFVDWEKCDAKFNGTFAPKGDNGKWNTKPMFLAGYPDSFLNTHAIFTALTNNPWATRSIFNSKKGQFSHCIATHYPTVACTVGMGLRRNNGNYDSKVILAIRNPKYAFPSFGTSKAQHYHGLVGQEDIASWRGSRDMWFEQNMNEWVTVINSYQESKEYEIAYYFNYDSWVKVDTGPQMMQELADLLKSRGFNVAPDKDIPCLWYQSVGKDVIEHYIDYKFNYIDYVPMYTEKQQQFMLKLLSSLIVKYGPDSEAPDDKLVGILKEYYEDIRVDTRIEEEGDV